MFIRHLALILLPSVALMGCAANPAQMTPELGTEEAAASEQIALQAFSADTVDIHERSEQRSACQRIRPQRSIIYRGSGPCYPPTPTPAPTRALYDEAQHIRGLEQLERNTQQEAMQQAIMQR